MPQVSDKLSASSVTRVKSKVKVVFLGEQSTGKTSILMRFLNGKFQQTQGATVGIDFMGKNYTVGNHHLRLQLWDTAGQQRFRSLIPSYLKDAMITLIVFDLTNQKSFDNINQWVDLCQHNRNDKNILIFLGNKCDLFDMKQVSNQKIQQKLQKYNGKYFQVSAKNGHNINQVFNYACNQFVKLHLQQNQLTFTVINQQMQKRFQNARISMSQNDVNDKNSKVLYKEQKKQNIQLKNDKQKKKKKKSGCC